MKISSVKTVKNPTRRFQQRTITPHTRALIIGSVSRYGSWTGRRHGIKICIELTPQPTLEGHRINWKARINKQWHSGTAGNASEALQAIEQKAGW